MRPERTKEERAEQAEAARQDAQVQLERTRAWKARTREAFEEAREEITFAERSKGFAVYDEDREAALEAFARLASDDSTSPKARREAEVGACVLPHATRGRATDTRFVPRPWRTHDVSTTPCYRN